MHGFGGEWHTPVYHDGQEIPKGNAEPPGVVWKRITLEFTTNARGGVLFLGFVPAGPGRAFFDDFRLAKVAE